MERSQPHKAKGRNRAGRPGSGVEWITGWAAGFRLGEDWVRKPEPNIARDRSPSQSPWLGWTGNHPIHGPCKGRNMCNEKGRPFPAWSKILNIVPYSHIGVLQKFK